MDEFRIGTSETGETVLLPTATLPFRLGCGRGTETEFVFEFVRLALMTGSPLRPIQLSRGGGDGRRRGGDRGGRTPGTARCCCGPERTMGGAHGDTSAWGEIGLSLFFLLLGWFLPCLAVFRRFGFGFGFGLMGLFEEIPGRA